MTTPTFESFTAQSQDEGFDEIIVREWDADLKLETHTHPFDVSAYVARGEYWLTLGAEVKHLQAGDFFRLARDGPGQLRHGQDQNLSDSWGSPHRRTIQALHRADWPAPALISLL
jgi:hypothetical protein